MPTSWHIAKRHAPASDHNSGNALNNLTMLFVKEKKKKCQIDPTVCDRRWNITSRG